MADFKPSDIVECIDDTRRCAETRVMPQLGQLYTITKVRAVGDGQSVRVRELIPTCYMGGPCDCGECGWDAGRFRKVYRPTSELIEALAVRICEPV